MPEEPTIDEASFTTPACYDPAVKQRAYDLFLSSNMSAVDIAIDTGLPQHVVASWIRTGGWRERKKEIDAELMKDAEDRYRRLVVEKRLPVVERHLRVSEKLETAIEKNIDIATEDGAVPNDMKLKRLAEALVSATGVSARAAAISDKPFSDSDEKDGKNKKRPLIIIGVTAQPSPGFQRPDPVTVTVDESE